MPRWPSTTGALAVAVVIVISGSLLWLGLAVPRSVHVDVELPVYDVDRLGVGTQLNVTLFNEGPRPVAPSFWVMWSAFVQRWDVLSGPIALASGSRANYTIRALTIHMGIPGGALFVVKVYDPDTSTYYRSASAELRLSGTKPVQNPSLSFWSRDLDTGVYHPFGWTLVTSDGGDDNLRIAPQASGAGVDESLIEGGSGSNSSFIHLQQEVSAADLHLLRSIGLMICWQRAVDYRSDPTSGNPLAASGLEMFGGGKLAWFVPSSAATVTYDRPGHRIFATQADPAKAGCFSVPIREMIDFVTPIIQGPAFLIVFVAAWPSAPGDYQFSVVGLA
jgi:hypothetical protein